MPPLAAIERFFERLFERPSARLFRTHVQPVQIQRRIERAMETGRRPEARRTVVPNRFVVHLHPDDLGAFTELADELATSLADEALSFARAHHYSLSDRPRVDLVADPTVQRADIRVDARVEGPPADESPPGSGRDAETATAGANDPDDTAVFMLPQATLPRAYLEVTDPDGGIRSVDIGSGGLTIGRAEDNDLIARDGRVSRHHGRIVGRRGTMIYLDLGSTNGSKVNGEPVSEVVLGVGDRLEVGDTTLVLEVSEAPGR
jgi:hypothetical protein